LKFLIEQLIREMRRFIAVIFFAALAIADQDAVSVGDYSEEYDPAFFRITGGTRAKPRSVPSFVALQGIF
jgi:hypothetical protein